MSESNDDDGEDNLPVVHPTEYKNPIDVMVAELRRLDGPMSASNAIVPKQAEDVGDVDVRPNPRAADLGYSEGVDPFHREDDEPHALVLWDDETGAGSYLRAESGSYVEDVALLA